MSDTGERDPYQYELPEERIAQHPPPTRNAARLLVWPAEGPLRHRRVLDLPELIRPGDVVVRNDTKVLPARLWGEKVVGSARVEVLLVAPVAAGTWEALVRPGRRLPAGSVVRLEGGVEVEVGDHGPGGLRRLRFPDEVDVLTHAERHGHIPLPPYIRRPDAGEDRTRYQTVYARVPGSVAAPTAGLHLDEELLAAMRAAGATVADLTLHVGPGTFRPVGEEQLRQGRLHAESIDIPAATVTAVRSASRVVAVGTTTCRALESLPEGATQLCGSTDLFIRPGHRFRHVDVLLTNFHLPGSSLLMLVAAFAGPRWRAAYRVAVEAGYRFYSYGDANWIERTA